MTDKLIGCVQHDCEKCKEREASYNEAYRLAKLRFERIAELESFREVDADTMNAMQAEIEQRDALIAELEAEVEQLRVQLAGCGVVAMQNTEDSKAERIKRGAYGWSESYGDVCRAVDREIALRAELARLKAAVQDYRETLNAGGIELPERLCAILASGAAQRENT